MRLGDYAPGRLAAQILQLRVERDESHEEAA